MAVEIRTESDTQDPEYHFWLKWKRVNLDTSIPTISTLGEKSESFLFNWWKLRTEYQRGDFEILQLQEKGRKLFDDYGEMTEKVERAINLITGSTQRKKLD